MKHELPMVIGALLSAGLIGCGTISQPTQREQTAAIGALAGGAGGAIIGSFAGSALAGGLFGMPLGAIAGYYAAEQVAGEDRAAKARSEQTDAEIARLRKENQRLREQQATARPAQPQETLRSEQDITAKQPSEPARQEPTEPRQAKTRVPDQSATATGTPAYQPSTASQPIAVSREELQIAQQKLNEMGFDAGQVDGIWGPNTETAVRNFQRAKGLRVTGQLNEETLKALGLEGAPRTGAAASAR